MSCPSSESSSRKHSFPNRISSLIAGCLAVILLGVIGAYYVGAVDSQIIGFTHDDGVYLSTAKALATGKGFKLLHVVGHPAEIKYPFMYPILLAPIWYFFPDFPQNVPLFSYLSIAFTLGALWLVYGYCRSVHQFPGWLALWVIALVASNFFFIYFSTTVMSEAPYLFFSLLTLWVFHTLSRNRQVLSQQAVLLLIVLSAITFLTRIPGVALMAAIGSWLLLNRQWKNAAVYGIGCLLLGILPWSLWVKFHTPPLNELSYPLVNAYSNYGLEFMLNYLGSSGYWKSLSVSFSSFLSRLLEDMFPLIPNLFRIYPPLQSLPYLPQVKDVTVLIGTYALAGYFLLQAIRTCSLSLANKRFSPAYISVPGLYLFFYTLMVLFWNYEDQMARFIMVLTPLLWLYFFKPALPMLKALKSRPLPGRAVTVWVILGLLSAVAFWPVCNAYRIVWKSRNQHWVESGKAKWLWSDYQDSFAWIRANTPPHAPIAAASDVVYYLYTDRPSFYLFYASLKRKKGRFTPDAIPLLMKSLDHYGVKYMAVEPHMQVRVIRAPQNLIAKDLLKAFPHRFQQVYSSPHKAINIYKILPQAEHLP